MLAVVLLTLSMFMLGVLLSIAVGTGVNPQILTNALSRETMQYFENISAIMNNDMTPNRLQAMASGQGLDTLFQQGPIRQLAPGRWGNASFDAWGNTIQGTVVRQNISLNANIQVPVTGVALVSAGPDRVFQTAVGTITTLSGLQGVVAPAGSDDLVLTFTDEEAQRENYNRVMVRMERIASAMLRDYQNKFSAYTRTLQTNYEQQLKTNPAALPPDVSTMLQTDPNAPRFTNINDMAARQSLGVSEEFNVLERVWPDGGRFQVTGSSADLRQGVTVQLRNLSGSATPWTIVNININLQGGGS